MLLILLIGIVLLSQPAAGQSPGTMIDLGTLGGSWDAAYDINERGQIVGSSYIAAGESHAFLWNYGTMIDLGTLGGPFIHSTAVDVNERGQIIGNSRTTSGEEHAFLWDRGTMIDLGTLGGNNSRAIAINDLRHLDIDGTM